GTSRCTLPMCGGSGQLQGAVVPVGGTFLTFYRYRPRICWPTPNGAPSVGAPARKASSRLVSPLSGCGSPTDHHSGSGTRANNICPATRLGSSANTGCLERRNTSRHPASEDRPEHLSNHHQGALGLRAGSPADERRTWS